MSSTATSATASDSLIGKTLAGRFRILSRIATGGMGVVYKAEQLPLKRVVALKVLEAKTTPDMDQKFGQRFFLEAAAAAKLSHPNTIVVYDYGQAEDDLFYIAMEHVGGGTVERHLKEHGPFTPAQVIHMGLQICSSLRDAHEQGLVHRDLKPGNVMFAPRAGDPFFVKVLDFGLVKVVGAGEEREDGMLTQNGIVMGSPRYMAPEQVRSLTIDHRADIYSLGATLYHMLTGAPPFAGGKAFDAMAAHVTLEPPSLRETWSDCPADDALERVVMRCLAKSPDDRFQDMEEVMIALHDCVHTAGPLTSGNNYLSHVSLPPRLGERSDSNPSNPSQPRTTDPNSATQSNPALRASASGSHSSPRISGPRRKEGLEDVAVDVVVEEQPAKRSSSKTYLAGGAAVLVVAMATAGWAMTREDPPAPRSSPEPAAAPAEPLPAETPADSTPSPVRLETTPAGARARHDGSDLGDTPLEVPIPRGERWEIELSHPGFESRVVTVRAGQARVAVTLQARPAAGSPVAAEVEPQAPARPRWPVRRPQRGTRDQGSASGDDSERAGDIHDPWNQEE